MSISKINSGFLFLLIIIFLSFSASTAIAQTTAFTYQGKLTDSGNLANAAYDMQFKLFDATTNGNQIGATLTFDGNSGNPPSVSVTNGIFTVSLDFGSVSLSGADRYLEIGLKPAGNPGGYQQLLPRQKLTSTPYAVQALKATTATNATQLGGVAASQYVVTSDTRLSDARQPLAGSGNYIQNTGVVQSADFNIDGDGTANIFNARTEFQIGGQHALSVRGNQNIFAGVGAGAANTTGFSNSFFGKDAGAANTTASGNAFFGYRAGFANTASGNAFVGASAGTANTTGTSNAFFGTSAGATNTTGSDNAFFGANTGLNNTASFNAFFGSNAGDSTTSGGRNAFFGYNAGQANQTGGSNSFFGYKAGSLTNSSYSNSFFGASAGESNTTGGRNSFFGYIAGSSNGTASDNSFFGYAAGTFNTGSFNSIFGSGAGESSLSGGSNAFFGYAAGQDSTTGNSNSFFGSSAGFFNSSGSDNTFIGNSAGSFNTTGSSNTIIGSSAGVGSGNLDHATAIGADSVANLSNSIYLGRADGSDAVRIPGPTVINGSLVVGTLGSAGSTSICLNVANRIAPCSSSLRYKSNVQTFTGGLDIIRHLRPITFTWKEGGMSDVGFAAEEVQAIAPLLATYNKDGQIEGVKYGQLTTVLVNAVKQQQTQIEAQQSQIEAQKQQLAAQQLALQQQQQQHQAQQNQLRQQQQQFAALKKLVCSSHRRAAICQ